MSTLNVTAEQLTIHPHGNADALELAQVGLYRAVVPKGTHKTGDWAIYIPEQAVLPKELIEELGLVGRLAGANKDRVKAIRLRGELSQGIVCLPDAIDPDDLPAAAGRGHDFAEELGIVKWVPQVPAHMDGRVLPATDLLPWVTIEHLKRHPHLFIQGEPVTATEKAHGTTCLTTLVTETGEVLVTSKGQGAKHLTIVEDPTNLYWRAVRAYDVPSAAQQIAKFYGADRVGIFGEVYGQGVQDLTYGHTATGRPGYAVFDVSIDVGGDVRWLPQDEMVDVLADALPTVPRLYTGPFDIAHLLALAEGREQISGTEACIREGVVVRSATERPGRDSRRLILKVVSEAYLTRKGGTEYE